MSLGIESMSPADIAAVTGNSNNGGNDGWGGNNGWWIIILLLALGRGWGYGNGGNGGQGYSTQPIVIDSGRGCGCGCAPCATQADVRAAVDQQTLISKIDQQTYGFADSTYAITNTLNQNFRGIDNAICSLGYNTQAGFNSLAHQLSDCCCATQRAIDGVRYDLATQACDTRHTIYNSTRDIIDNANANSRAILDFLTKDKIDTLQNENLALKFAASQSAQNAFITANQEAQTAELIRRLGADCPVPAYVVPNPNCCYQYNVTPTNNCGCNAGF